MKALLLLGGALAVPASALGMGFGQLEGLEPFAALNSEEASFLQARAAPASRLKTVTGLFNTGAAKEAARPQRVSHTPHYVKKLEGGRLSRLAAHSPSSVASGVWKLPESPKPSPPVMNIHPLLRKAAPSPSPARIAADTHGKDSLKFVARRVYVEKTPSSNTPSVGIGSRFRGDVAPSPQASEPPNPPEPAATPPKPSASKPFVDSLRDKFRRCFRITASAADRQRQNLARGGKSDMGTLLKQVITDMGADENGKIVLHDVRDSLTGKLVSPKVELTFQKFLGRGTFGAVAAMDVINAGDQKILGASSVAVKVPYIDFSVYDGLKDAGSLANTDLAASFNSELSPFRTLSTSVRSSGRPLTARDIQQKFGWAMAIYEGRFGAKDSVHHKGAYFFFSRVLLFDTMSGDLTPFVSSNPQRIPLVKLLPKEAEHTCGQLIDAAGQLNAKRLVHGDIKPANTLIAPSGRLYLSDFGVAVTQDEKRTCGDFITPLYTDPTEAACYFQKGKMPADPKADSWSTGATCYILMMQNKLPYNILGSPSALKRLAALLHEGKNIHPQTLPESELSRAGISPFFAKLVGNLLKIDRSERMALPEAAKLIRENRPEVLTWSTKTD